MSQLFHLGGRVDDQASVKEQMDILSSQLDEENSRILALEKEIKTLKLKVRNQDEAGKLAAADNVSLREELEKRREEICDLKYAAETFEAEKNMTVHGAKVVASWELMREWIRHQIDS